MIEDDPVIHFLSTLLRRHGYRVDVAADGAAAFEALARRTYDIALLDLLMPKENGYDVIQKLTELDPDFLTCVIVVTATVPAARRYAVHEKVFRVLQKPFDLDELFAAVDDCLEAKFHRQTQPHESNLGLD